MRAFAGESQARNRYTFAADTARTQKLYSIADMFEYTADQERAHAERYYDLLKEFSGETIFIEGGYPVDKQQTLQELARAAEHNEKEEADDVYQAFGDVAKQEGFLEVASAFYQIAEIEHDHQVRFGRIAQLLEKGEYFARPEESQWICTNCGHVHTGRQAPVVCPVCRHDQGYCLPYEFACYKGAGK
jgi:rubrerythrin